MPAPLHPPYDGDVRAPATMVSHFLLFFAAHSSSSLCRPHIPPFTCHQRQCPLPPCDGDVPAPAVMCRGSFFFTFHGVSPSVCRPQIRTSQCPPSSCDGALSSMQRRCANTSRPHISSPCDADSASTSSDVPTFPLRMMCHPQ
ncbi:hypothetical protein BC827DRAFT_1245854 [Russula dissimulans]|nr:hypothetical protein BC827DRAFT_1245854 [Russula dissimulans]